MTRLIREQYVVGHGMLAQAFHRNPVVSCPSVIFASGVSDSGCSDSYEFLRERRLLAYWLEELGHFAPFVYFSTCSVYDSDSCNTPYVLHKLSMEELVSAYPFGVVVRLPQVVGPAPLTSNTLVSYLVRKILASEEIQVWENAVRNVIDVDDVVIMLNEYLNDWGSFPKVFNLANSLSIGVPELINFVELALGRRALKNSVKKGSSYKIDVSVSRVLASRVNVDFNLKYLEKSIRKHYQRYRTL